MITIGRYDSISNAALLKNYFDFAAKELGIKADLLPYTLAEIKVKASTF
jgi:hypothetical protein